MLLLHRSSLISWTIFVSVLLSSGVHAEVQCKDYEIKLVSVWTACESPDDFLCFNEHHCVPVRWTCDGEPDCADQSDELTCSNITCNEDHVSCGDGKPCVLLSSGVHAEVQCKDYEIKLVSVWT